jgi:hypothetical protein
MGQVYECWWKICREIDVFSQFRISHVLRFISIYALFTDSPSYYPTLYKLDTESLKKNSAS